MAKVVFASWWVSKIIWAARNALAGSGGCVFRGGCFGRGRYCDCVAVVELMVMVMGSCLVRLVGVYRVNGS